MLTPTQGRVGVVGGSWCLHHTRLPVHPLRNDITWDLVEHYAIAPQHSGMEEWKWCVRVIDLIECENNSSSAESLCSRTRRLLDLFHDSEYLEYLEHRESRSAVDYRRHDTDGDAFRIRKRHREDEEGDVDESILPPKSVRGIADTTAIPDLMPLEDDAAHGLVQECTPFVDMWRTAIVTVAATVAAVEALVPEGSSSEDTFWCVCNWWGGRHHAHRDRAAGYCFLNDVVIGTLYLQQRLRTRRSQHACDDVARSRKPKVIVIDMDAHHGDGTQEAFYYDSSVYTLSTHRMGVGVFPGTGHAAERGGGFGVGCAANIPLREGATGCVAVPHLLRVISEAFATFRPDAVVLVCGGDCLQGDPLGGLNFTLEDIQQVTRWILQTCAKHGSPLLVLGAGGYVDTSFAKMAALITRDAIALTYHYRKGDQGDQTESDFEGSPLAKPVSVAVAGTSTATATDEIKGVSLTEMIPVPDSCLFFSLYGPSFAINTLPDAVFQRVETMMDDDSDPVSSEEDEIEEEEEEEEEEETVDYDAEEGEEEEDDDSVGE